MIKHALAFAVSTLLALPAIAQAAGGAASSVQAPAPLPVEAGEKLAVYWDSELYPQEAKALNEQGSAEVRVDYVKGAVTGEPSILVSSGSPRLDKAALSVARQLSAVPEGADPQAFTKRLRFHIEFVRDSHLTLKSKTCRELLDDVAYARKRSPDASLQTMRVYELIAGIYTIAYMQVSMQAAIKASDVMPKAYAHAVARCQGTPDSLFTETLTAEFKKLM